MRASEKTQILEIYAIAKALELAEERCRTVEAEQRPSSLCEKALDFFLQPWQSLARLREIPDGEELIGPGLLAVEELSSLDVQMELGWVPGHAGKLVNQLADQAANRGSKHCVGRRRAGRLMTLCGKREGNGLHTSRPIPWRLHLHPSTQAPKVPSDFVVEANTSRSSAQGRVWPVSSRGSKADERFRSTMSLERLWYGRGRRGIQSRGNSKKNRGHKRRKTIRPRKKVKWGSARAPRESTDMKARGSFDHTNLLNPPKSRASMNRTHNPKYITKGHHDATFYSMPKEEERLKPTCEDDQAEKLMTCSRGDKCVRAEMSRLVRESDCQNELRLEGAWCWGRG